MLKSIELDFTESGKLTLPLDGIAVFVGPNNSGKSLILREIEQALNTHPFPKGLKVLRDYDVEWPSDETVRESIERFKESTPEELPLGQVSFARLNLAGGREARTLDENTLLSVVTTKHDKRWFATQYLKWGVVRLDGRSRFTLTNDQNAGDLLGPPQNIFAYLFQDDKARLRVREIIHDAFGIYFVVDPTNLGQLRVRLSQDIPLQDEQSLNQVARDFYKKAVHIKDASDGVQAFVGIVSAVISGEFHTVLVDEPEAFLHPPLARKLGRNLASLAKDRGGTLVASTHSPDFLMGCVQAAQKVRVVRLEYRNGKSRARMIDSKALDDFFKKPLMRSANVISALFHDGVVVLESDNDRAFYSEIYNRLTEGKSNYPSILFINAQNKQTIKDIIGPLRQFGVPAAAIADIDMVKDGGKTWKDWLCAANIPDALHTGYGQQRSEIDTALKATTKNMKTDGGVKILNKKDKAAAEELFENLGKYGIFVVQRGELENWLEHLEVPGKKTDWTVAMLKRLGSDPASAGYVMPSNGDVWDFMASIAAWVSDPDRKGTS